MKPTDDEGFAFLHDLHSQCPSTHVIVFSESEEAAQKAREIGIDNVVEDVTGIVRILTAFIPEPESESPTRILVVDDDERPTRVLFMRLTRVLTTMNKREIAESVEFR